MIEQWEGFVPGKWCDEINVRSFIMKNYTEYVGDESFLCGPTENTTKLMSMINDLEQEELKRGGVYNADTSIISTLRSFISITAFSLLGFAPLIIFSIVIFLVSILLMIFIKSDFVLFAVSK